MTRSSFVRSSALLTLLVVIVQTVWALTIPAFRGPDEPHHVNSILRIASGGGWPEPGDAMLDPKIIEAGQQSGMIVPDGEDFTRQNRTQLHFSGASQANFVDMEVADREDRIVLFPVEAASPESAEIDQMTQHPPVYYAGGALIVQAFDLEDAPWDRLVQVLRLYGIFLTIPLVPSIIYTARRLGASRPWALAAGFLPLAVPQLLATSASVTNDTLAIGLGALTVAALAKAGTERISWKTVFLVGGSLGAALWTKGLLLALGLPLILVFMLAKNEPLKKRIIATLASGTLALAIGWWWVLNIFRYGVIQPAGFHRDPPVGWSADSADFGNFFSTAYRTFTNSFFSSFGWLESDFPAIIGQGLIILLIVLVVLSVVRAGNTRQTYVILLSPFVGLLLLLYVQAWSNYLSTAAVAGVQGRYLYPCFAVLGGIFLAIRRYGTRGYRILVGATLTIGAFGYLWMLRSAYPGGVWANMERFAEVVGLPQVGVWLIVLVYVLVIAAIAMVGFRWAELAPAEGHQVTSPKRNDWLGRWQVARSRSREARHEHAGDDTSRRGRAVRKRGNALPSPKSSTPRGSSAE